MHWFLYIIIGAGCGWLAADPWGGKKKGKVLPSMAVGAVGGVAIGVVVGFVFSALILIVKVLCVVFGVFVLLALLGVGKSD